MSQGMQEVSRSWERSGWIPPLPRASRGASSADTRCHQPQLGALASRAEDECLRAVSGHYSVAMCYSSDGAHWLPTRPCT